MRQITALAIGTMTSVVLAQDFTIGYSKVSGMAGSGLALRHEGTGAYPRNPAGLAYMQKYKLTNLDFGYVLDGIRFNKVGDFLKSFDKGGLDADDLGELAQNFGDRNTSFGLNARLGAGANGINVGIEAVALVRTTPNAQLKQWVDSGSDPNNIVPGMRLDGHGYGYRSFNIGYGRPVPTKDGSNMAVGIQSRVVKTYYAHHYVDQNQVVGGGSTKSIEMNGQDVLSKSGIGIDLGWYMETLGPRKVELAAVLVNVIKPNVDFDGTKPDSLELTTIDPFERSINLGAGYTFERGQIVAADFINIGTHEADFRMGFDYPINQRFGVRAGYSGKGHFTAGFTAFGVSITWGTTNQFQAGTFFRF